MRSLSFIGLLAVLLLPTLGAWAIRIDPGDPALTGVILRSDAPATIFPTTSITFTATPMGGGSAVQYQFSVAPVPGLETIVQAYGADATLDAYTFGTAGEYAVIAYAREGATEVYRMRFFTVIAAPPLTAVTLTADATSPVLSDTPITFTATATGGSSVQYQFGVEPIGGGETTAQAFGADATLDSYTFGAAGTFTVSVIASDGVTEVWDSKTFTVTAAMSGVALTSDAPATIFPTTPITFTATATGGGSAVQYKFSVAPMGSEDAMVQAYGADATLDAYTFGTAGRYEVIVYAREGATKKSASLFFTVIAAPLTAVTLTADATSPVLSDTPITFTATATGGSDVQYVFVVGPSDGGETTAQALGADATLDSYTFGAAGTFIVSVIAKDGVTEVWDSKTFTVTAAMSGVNLAASLPSPIAVGKTVKLSATPVGGAKAWFKYAYEKQDANGVYRPDASRRGDTTSPTTLWKPSETGTYRVTVTCRERSVASVTEFTDSLVLVVEPAISKVEVTLGVASKVALGDSVSATAAVTGGANPRLRFLVGYRAAQYGTITWDQTRLWGTDDALAFTPTKAGYYTIRAYAREAANTAYYEKLGDTTVQVAGPLLGVRLDWSPRPFIPALPITFTAQPVGGLNLEYRFFVQTNPKVAAVELTAGYTTTPSITTWQSGNATIIVYVREVGSSAKFDMRRTFAYVEAS